jgi:hypothetical protein
MGCVTAESEECKKQVKSPGGGWQIGCRGRELSCQGDPTAREPFGQAAWSLPQSGRNLLGRATENSPTTRRTGSFFPKPAESLLSRWAAERPLPPYYAGTMKLKCISA